MSWQYRISTGELTHDDAPVGVGYSGKGAWKNVPTATHLPFQGPIPVGWYTKGEAYDSATHGPITIPLEPDATNQMFGRDEFKCHGDSVKEPGTASEGCIIQGHAARVEFSTSPDDRLEVVA